MQDERDDQETAAESAVDAAAKKSASYPRPLVIIVGVVLSIIGLIALQQVSSFVTPVFLGFNLVLAISPFFHWMIRRRVPKILAGVIAALLVYALLILFVLLLVWSVALLIQELPKYGTQFNELYRTLLDWLGSFGITQDTLLSQLQGLFNPAQIASLLQGLMGNFGNVMSLFATLLVVIFFIFFDAVTFEPRMEAVRRERPLVGAAFDSFSQGVGRYWVVTTVFGLIVAVIDVIALEMLGVPLALVWGVFSFLTNYIPNIGFVIGMIPPVLMALLANGWVNALVVLAVWSIINFVIQSLIQPKFAGEAVGVTPTVSFLSLLVWAFALGPVGALLALPATLLVKAVLVDANPDARWINILISSDPKLDDDVEQPKLTHEGDSEVDGTPAG
ncbi:AI-2E family transporter [Gulosibacter molinativorax]|uniref:AI-2E family transporter n=1 Tax=Gulosibacter molinativorax TaxID=256821 RepID=A0ABT7CAA3_9MICO|nr:AI-2E family transporter [Gulosibacter molinativorax]MDJ1371729.1 AI-2E family transporter [Gulosibacter molinativorax]QUY63151.1 Pheromone autoinducer 2 transporter [Gulosibacter molinativorax]